MQMFKTNDILLVCKLGELFKLYQLCNIFYLGGTFVPVGGHNLLEPAVWVKPSIIGPHYQNTKDIADKLEKENGLIKVKNENEFLEYSKKLLQNNQLLNEMSKNAHNWLIKESQVVENNLENLIEKLV
jgi:3-deoxy-D-manno-octulosonic-acid transferase